MKVVCLTVVYPGVEEFIEEYIKCIQEQTFKDFELVVISDRFPMLIEPYIRDSGINAKVFESSQSPLKNRIYGLKVCRELGYDVVVCSDSDETMHKERIGEVVEYFGSNNDSQIVYNNGIWCKEGKCFDLYYKDCIKLLDIVDFNVLGYGALNLRSDIIPFILKHENEKVLVFDWWIGSVYLLHFKKVDFLKDIENNYRAHPHNFVGPVLDIQKERVELGILVKKHHYSELAIYCQRNGFGDKVGVFEDKLAEIVEIEKFIEHSSIEHYVELVRRYFDNEEKIYWWQDVVSLNNCNKIKS